MTRLPDDAADPIAEFAAAYLGEPRRSIGEYTADHAHAFDLIADAVLERHLRAAGTADADPDAVADDTAQTRIGPYAIERELGRGGQAVVYLAHDTRLHRRVALKVLLGGAPFLSSQSSRRFAAEARITARLDHPGICAVYESGVDGDLPYIAMRYVEGRSLAEWIARANQLRPERGYVLELGATAVGEVDGAPEPDATAPTVRARIDRVPTAGVRDDTARTLRVIEEAARALHAAHEVGVVHRDIKPSNLMIDADGEPVVLDFGLARDDDSQLDALTRTGEVCGTPAYMAPEQIRGKSPDRRTDVYALGVTLYEALSGQRPFESPGGHDALRREILAGRPRSLARLRPGLSREVCVVVATAMECDPNRRYATALDFARDLERIRTHHPIVAEPAGAWLRARRWVQRHPYTAAIVSILVVAAGVTGVLFTMARAALDDFSRLADARLLARLEREAEVELWPMWVERVPRGVEWLAAAEALAARLPSHRARLADLRARALPYTDERRTRDLRQHRRAAERTRLVDRLAAAEQGVGTEAGVAAARVAAPRDREALVEIDAEIERERSWEFVDPGEQVLHDTLALLIADLERFTAPEGTLGIVAQALARAREHDAAVARDADRWRAAIDAIAASDRYAGLRITPQQGLVPLRCAPESGLWEFANTASGSLPVFDAGPGYHLADDTCIVLVLLPGGSARLGCQVEDRDAPNFDLGAAERPTELFLADVVLEPFFCAKYELTQAQWQALGGESVSAFRAGTTHYGQAITPRHPVEDVTWERFTAVLARFEFELPTEAQWEYAARAGSGSVWWVGSDSALLEGAANLLDATASAEGFKSGFASIVPHPWADGWTVHAPVGSFRPNPFGLHDTSGNIAEWCRDLGARFDAHPLRPGDGELLVTEGSSHAVRGGNFGWSGEFARSGFRAMFNGCNSQWGCRPVRRLIR